MKDVNNDLLQPHRKKSSITNPEEFPFIQNAQMTPKLENLPTETLNPNQDLEQVDYKSNVSNPEDSHETPIRPIETPFMQRHIISGNKDLKPSTEKSTPSNTQYNMKVQFL